jgi:hypothetical protein
MSDLTGRPIVTNVTGEPWGYGLRRMLEVKAQRDLTCTVAGAFRRLCCRESAKGSGTADVRRGRGKPHIHDTIRKVRVTC